jgi:hypothetical protein
MFVPERWKTEEIHRLLVAHAIESHRSVVFNPARRHVLSRNAGQRSNFSQFFGASFAAICENQRLLVPNLVIENRTIDSAIHQLYDQEGIPWVTTDALLRDPSLLYDWKGENETRRESVLTESNALIASEPEFIFRLAINRIKADYGVESHHQVPLRYVFPNMIEYQKWERGFFYDSLDAVIVDAVRDDVDYMTVFLAVQLHFHESHQRLNKAVRDLLQMHLFDRHGVPLLTIIPFGDASTYQMACPVLGLNSVVKGKDSAIWAVELEHFVSEAIRYGLMDLDAPRLYGAGLGR